MAIDIKCPECEEAMHYETEVKNMSLEEGDEIYCSGCDTYFEIVDMDLATNLPSKLKVIEPGLDIEEDEEEEEEED